MMWLWIILLVVAGIFLIVLEVIAIPGTTIAGLFGLALFGFGIWTSYSSYGSTIGHITLGVSLLIGVCFFTYCLRSKAWNRFKLKDQIDSRVNTIDEEKIKEGDIGTTISRLAPMGKALFHDELYEVQCLNELIDQETDIEIIKIEGNKITVKKINQSLN